MEDVKKAVVSLIWYDKNMVDKPGTGSSSLLWTTGFIFQQDVSGIYILTTSHQFSPLFSNTTDVPNSRIGVRVDFFDNTTTIDGFVVHYDLVKDLTLVHIFACEKLSHHPIPCIKSIGFSDDPTHQSQSVYSIHHPHMFNVNTGQLIEAYNQYTEGFVADDTSHDIGQVHFWMPLIFSGSSGTPVLDKYSNKLVSMILGCDPYQGHGPNNNVQYRHRGVLMSTIRQFLEDAQAANSPPKADMVM